MSYHYQTERSKLFTEEGQVTFMKVRDNVLQLLSTAGAFTASNAWKGVSGDTWLMMACLDRLVELGEIEHCPRDGCWAQFEVYAGKKRYNY